MDTHTSGLCGDVLLDSQALAKVVQTIYANRNNTQHKNLNN